MPSSLSHDFILLFAVIDPIGSLPMFLSITRHYSPEKKARTAFKAVAYSALILCGFLLVGQALLHAIGIRLGAFQISGGSILFLYGLQMIFRPDQEEYGSGGHREPGHDAAVFPLAIPSLASPGALTAIIILTDNRLHPPIEQTLTALLMLSVLAIAWLLMRLAPQIYKLLGDNGTAILVRVMGLMVTALAVEICIEGLASLQWLTLPPE